MTKALGVLLATVLVAGCTATPTTPAGSSATNTTRTARAVPTTITIPTIGVKASIEEIGLQPDGALQDQPLTHANLAAWYRLGPTPGQVGPAVIVGHVDTKHSRGVFYNLHRLRPGASVLVGLADGSSVAFTVDQVGQYPKTEFPTELVYGSTVFPALRLVTCGGVFDRAAGSYLDNIVVYAHLEIQP